MGTIDPVIFKKYRYGYNNYYKHEYLSLHVTLHNAIKSMHPGVSKGYCYGAACVFVYEIMSGRNVDFFSDHSKLHSWLLKAMEHQSVYLKSGTDASHLVKQMEYFVIKKPDAFYKLDPNSAVASTNAAWQIMEFILRYPDRFPLGYIELESLDSKYKHATAFACDKNYIYYYEPNCGLMRIDRNDFQQIDELFIRSYRKEFRLARSYSLWSKKPAVIIKPYKI